MTRILREYRREWAAHSITTMCGALAFMAAVTWGFQARYSPAAKLVPGEGLARMVGAKWTY